jgi:23S rRNA (adenine2030-N6)-methyltransferase
MNYRHAYHAGNFADVLKHAVLALVIEYLKRKDAPFRVIDTHAGAGRYALGSVEAGKTGEWRQGIGRLIGPDAEALSDDVARVLAPYLDAVRAENAPHQLAVYPGSPLIAQRLMRGRDVLVANELHPEDAASLKAAVGKDSRVRLLALDGWTALKSLLPPKERRGVVLVDPPFEEQGELARLADGLDQAIRRFETGVYLAWYPIKGLGPIARFRQALGALAAREMLCIELMIRADDVADRLNGCGLVVVNPPYALSAQLERVLPELVRRLALSPGACHRLERIAAMGAGTKKQMRRPSLARKKRAGRKPADAVRR